MSRFSCTFKPFGAFLRLAALACLISCELDTGLPLDATSQIAAFELRMADNPSLSQDVSGAISDSSITLNVPADTDVTSLVPTIQHTGESISPASGEAQDFTDPVEYIVTAADGSESVFTVSVFVAAANSKDIRSFRVGSTQATIDGTNISLTLPHNTDVTGLAPVIGHTGVEISPASNSEQDFSSPVQYTVTAQDGSTKTYTVTINTAASNAKDITELRIGSVVAEINGTQITLTLPHGTDARALEPTVTYTGGSVEPESGVAQDFRGPVTYIVTAADGSSQSYTVTVNIAPSSAKNITNFSIDGVAGQISGTAISVSLPYGTDITYLAPTVQHTGASVSPASTAPRDFSQPVTYTVTAADGSTKQYAVTVSIAPNSAKEIIDFVILGSTAQINGSTITLTVPHGATLSALIPTIVHSGTQIAPASGVMQDFSDPFEYVVTAADGSTHAYTVIVTVAASNDNTITSFELLDVEAQVSNGSIALTLPFGTNVSAVAPQITHTGASIEPAVGTPLSFATDQTYTVTAHNGETRLYTVHVTIAPNTAKAITRFVLLGHEAEIDGTDITLTLPHGTNVSSLTPDITHTGASIDPEEADAQDFSEPVTYTVTAANNSTQTYTVTVTVAADDAYEITGFTILNRDGVIGVGTVALTVPFGTNLTNLAPTITITGVSVEPDSGIAQDFSEPVTYTVTAENGETKDYIVTVNAAPSDAKGLSNFQILGRTATIQNTAVTLTLPFGTDKSQLTPTFMSSGTNVQPPSNVPQNFNSPVVYRVTAADNSFTDYTVTVSLAQNDAKNISGFTIQGAVGVIGTDTITVTLPFGTNRTALAPQIAITGDAVAPASNIPRDFSTPKMYTVTASDGTTKIYTVTVQLAPNDAKNILTFDILGVTPNITANAVSLTVPYNTVTTALMPTISISGATISPASGVSRDFTNPVQYTVTAEDGTTHDYTVTVTVARNFAKDITSFKIGNAEGVIGANSIAITVPHGSTASSLTPIISTSGVSVAPGSGVPNDFTSTTNYEVTADDGTKKTYSVTVTVAQNDAKDISTFTILGVQGNIVGSAISLTVPYNTNPSTLTPTISITGQSVSPASGALHDFSTPATYTVTAEDGTTKPYTVTVNVAQNSAKDIDGFTILGVPGNIVGNAISLTVPYGSSPSSLTPTISITGQSVSPASGSPHNFSSPAMYTVTAQDGTMKAYTVTVNVALNDAKDISTFKIMGVDGVVGPSTVAITLPYGTLKTGLTPTITHTGQTVSPASGASHDFTSPATYTVTAQDGTHKDYTVTVTIAQNTANDITALSILGEIGVVGQNTVAVTVPFGTNRNGLMPTIMISGQTISPASGVAQDFTNPVTYTVTADDGSMKQYMVSVSVAANTAKDISTFSIMGISGTVGATTVTLVVPYGTNLMALAPTVTFTGASVSPPSGMATDFTNAVTYTVTADNNSTKDYAVTVTNATAAVDCRALLTAFPATTSGVHTIDPDGAGGVAPFSVYCDMTNNGGGWTLIGKTAAGDYTALTDAQYFDLILNEAADVNPSLLQTGTAPSAGQIAFYDKAKTNALYHASGALRAVRIDLSNYQNFPSNDRTYFQQRVTATASNWDFWLALRNARMWNSDYAEAAQVTCVDHFGTDFVLSERAIDFDATTNVVTHHGDAAFCYFQMYTYTRPDTSQFEVSRHMGLLGDGIDNVGWLWLLTADPNDARFKDDWETEQKSLIWLR